MYILLERTCSICQSCTSLTSWYDSCPSLQTINPASILTFHAATLAVLILLIRGLSMIPRTWRSDRGNILPPSFTLKLFHTIAHGFGFRDVHLTLSTSCTNSCVVFLPPLFNTLIFRTLIIWYNFGGLLDVDRPDLGIIPVFIVVCLVSMDSNCLMAPISI